MSGVSVVTVEKLGALACQQEVELLDVRTPVEFREVHAVCARNVPLDELEPHAIMRQRNGSAAKPLYVICKSGARGMQACRRFWDAGYTNVINVEGGTLAWDAAGLPVVRGKEAISLERQVRIAAGGLVLLSSLLAMISSPYWAGLSAFVGAGVAFAGLTEWCGMALLLARMPWNKIENSGASCCASR
ncbi:MAG: rhodanese-like domain-containing protein [Pirellulaceae bacterium]|nr:rhodanese-like domain-containing protein [Planctomycetales bacterium]